MDEYKKKIQLEYFFQDFICKKTKRQYATLVKKNISMQWQWNKVQGK
jgi:hypothetical protein